MPWSMAWGRRKLEGRLADAESQAVPCISRRLGAGASDTPAASATSKKPALMMYRARTAFI